MLNLRTGMMGQVVRAGRYLIDIAADGPRHRIFAADRDENTVHVVDGETGSVRHTVKVGPQPESVVVAERAGRVFVDNAGDDRMTVLDAQTGSVVRTVPGASGYAFVSAERTGRVFGVSGSTVIVRDASSGALVTTVKIPGGQTSALGVSEGTDHIFVTNSDHRSVSMLDAGSGRVLRTVRVGSNPTALAVDEQAGRVFVANQDDGTVSVLAATTGQVLGTLRVGVTPLAIGIDSRRGLAFVYNATSEMVSVLDTRATLSPQSLTPSL